MKMTRRCGLLIAVLVFAAPLFGCAAYDADVSLGEFHDGEWSARQSCFLRAGGRESHLGGDGKRFGTL